jgi:16S rRNA (adenine1518-N6/adenine1519-N6)-dimethyltransferase
VPRLHRQKLGQHFLADSGFRRRIADSLSLHADDLVIEIGAGRGAMTGLLAERARRVVAVELDRALVQQLKEKFEGDPRIEILHSDILSTDLAVLCRRHETERCFVFGNLPYYITSPILDRLGIFRNVIRAMGLLVQREVADRLIAPPGSSDYGYLSVFVQLFSRPRFLFSIPPGAFSPPPKVHSAFVEFQIHPRFPKLSPKEQERLLNFVKRCFAKKRKNIINNLSGMAPRARVVQALEQLQLPTNIRAEQLSIGHFADLLARLD